MDRQEAVAYLRELFSQCNDLSPNAVSFEQPKNGDSVGYRVRIRGNMHETDKTALKEIAKKRNLTVKDDRDEVIVYNLK
ncbi:MAG: hypothetical protein ACQCN6_10570 [Candidatus Bathyarchaeia archaeon]|jgi:hypothetical protein